MAYVHTQGRQYIETSDRGILRRLDEDDLGAFGAAVPGAAEGYTVRGQRRVSPSQQNQRRPVSSSDQRHLAVAFGVLLAMAALVVYAIV